jgi:hypothetical protein
MDEWLEARHSDLTSRYSAYDYNIAKSIYQTHLWNDRFKDFMKDNQAKK